MPEHDPWNLEQAVLFYHYQVDRGKFRGWNCSCDYEFTKLMVFKEAYDKWLS